MRDDFDNEWLKKNHRRNSLKIHVKNHVNRGQMNPTNTHIHDRLHTLLN